MPEGRSLPAQQIVELRAIQGLVRELAGLPPPQGAEDSGETANRLYDSAPPLVQSRFDALASEAAAIAAAGLSALIEGRQLGTGASAAAAHLAREMERSIQAMENILGRA